MGEPPTPYPQSACTWPRAGTQAVPARGLAAVAQAHVHQAWCSGPGPGRAAPGCGHLAPHCAHPLLRARPCVRPSGPDADHLPARVEVEGGGHSAVPGPSPARRRPLVQHSCSTSAGSLEVSAPRRQLAIVWEHAIPYRRLGRVQTWSYPLSCASCRTTMLLQRGARLHHQHIRRHAKASLRSWRRWARRTVTVRSMACARWLRRWHRAAAAAARQRHRSLQSAVTIATGRLRMQVFAAWLRFAANARRSRAFALDGAMRLARTRDVSSARRMLTAWRQHASTFTRLRQVGTTAPAVSLHRVVAGARRGDAGLPSTTAAEMRALERRAEEFEAARLRRMAFAKWRGASVRTGIAAGASSGPRPAATGGSFVPFTSTSSTSSAYAPYPSGPYSRPAPGSPQWHSRHGDDRRDEPQDVGVVMGARARQPRASEVALGLHPAASSTLFHSPARRALSSDTRGAAAVPTFASPSHMQWQGRRSSTSSTHASARRDLPPAAGRPGDSDSDSDREEDERVAARRSSFARPTPSRDPGSEARRRSSSLVATPPRRSAPSGSGVTTLDATQRRPDSSLVGVRVVVHGGRGAVPTVPPPAPRLSTPSIGYFVTRAMEEQARGPSPRSSVYSRDGPLSRSALGDASPTRRW